MPRLGTRLGITSLAVLGGGRSPSIPFIVLNGESNSGGKAVNSALSAGEAAARPQVQILNNTSLGFEDLDIGTNNLIGHASLTANATHGLENSLANAVEAGRFGGDFVWLVKTGQGGSVIGEWDADDAYTTTMTTRINAALALATATGRRLAPMVVISLGINDAIAATNVATYKAGLIAHIGRIRALLGATTPVVLTRFDRSMPASYETYNVALDEIADADDYCTVVRTNGSEQVDTNHWNYEGFKVIGEAIWDILDGAHGQLAAPDISLVDGTATITPPAGAAVRYTLDGSRPTSASTLYTEPVAVPATGMVRAIAIRSGWSNSPVAETSVPAVSWEELVNATASGNTLTRSSSSAAGGQATARFDGGAGFLIEIDQTNTNQEHVVVFMTSVETPDYVWASALNTGGKGAMNLANGNLYHAATVYAVNNTGAQSRPCITRLERQGQGTRLSVSTDGGLTWVPRSCYHGGLSAADGTLYLRTLFALTGTPRSATVRAAGISPS